MSKTHDTYLNIVAHNKPAIKFALADTTTLLTIAEFIPQPRFSVLASEIRSSMPTDGVDILLDWVSSRRKWEEFMVALDKSGFEELRKNTFG